MCVANQRNITKQLPREIPPPEQVKTLKNWKSLSLSFANHGPWRGQRLPAPPPSPPKYHLSRFGSLRTRTTCCHRFADAWNPLTSGPPKEPADPACRVGSWDPAFPVGSRRSGNTSASSLLPSAHWAPTGASAGCAPLRGLCAPGRLPPGPSAAAALALHGTQGLAGGPGKPVQLAASPPALVARQRLPASPRPASVRLSSVAALFPPLCRTGQTGFPAPGWSLLSPPAAAVAARCLGTKLELPPGRAPPSALPSLDPSPKTERGWATRPGTGLGSQAPGRDLGQVATLTVTDLCLFCDPVVSTVLGSRGAPVPYFRASTPQASRHFPTHCCRFGHRPGSVTAPARKAGGVSESGGPELLL